MLAKISDIITWYNGNAQKATIDMILAAKDRLVTLNYNLGEMLADSQTEFNKKYFIRRISIAKKEAYHIQQGEAISKAKTVAVSECEFEFKEELDAESYANKVEILLRQSNRVVDAMQQRISVLKKEYPETHQ